MYYDYDTGNPIMLQCQICGCDIRELTFGEYQHMVNNPYDFVVVCSNKECQKLFNQFG